MKISSPKIGFWIFSSCLFLGFASLAESERPNVLLITSEDNGPELGCYGEPYVKTPRLDALAESGVRFHRAFVTQAGCSQSRSSILTGLYPHQNGQIGLATWDFRMYREDTPNVVRSLKDAGYRTGIVGKLHVNPASAFPFDFREIKTANFARKDLAAYARHAGAFMRASDQPFFLMVNYPDAHRPFLTQVENMPTNPLTGNDVRPLAYIGLDHPELRQQTADHYNSMNRLDTLIGELLDTLEANSKTENTLVIYLGDHGADLLRGKRNSYEGGLRVPMIASWPGVMRAGQVRQELVSTIDLFPTILEATGVEAPGGLPGRSMIPLIKGEIPEWRTHLFAEWHLHGLFNFYPQRSVRDDRFKLIHNLVPSMENPEVDFATNRYFKEVGNRLGDSGDAISAAYRLMKNPPEFELYDLQRDPYEFDNLSSNENYRQIQTELKQELAAWRENTNDPLRHPEILRRWVAEIETAIGDGKPQKNADWKWRYLEYFLETH